MMAYYTASGCQGQAMWQAAGCCGGWYPAPVPMPATVVLEALADSTSTTKKVLIGGTTPVRLTLEYLPDEGATSPSVSVTVAESGGATSTWKETAIPAGYHVKSEWLAVAPGSLVTLEVAEASARLRWCETICC